MTEEGASTTLPGLYARWLGELLGGPIPDETEATCSDCAMCPPRTLDPAFDPRVKCCTYLPTFPSFLAGAILAEAHPDAVQGQATIRGRLRDLSGVTPLGIGCAPDLVTFYRERVGRGFGRDVTLKCPHYEPVSGRCTVWRHRTAVCATYHCKHVRGAVGRGFWRSVNRLLSAVESDLARWCLLELNPGREALERLIPSVPDAGNEHRWAPESRTGCAALADDLWGRFRGQEEEFYLECARMIAPLDWAAVLQRIGGTARIAAHLCQAAYLDLQSTEIPPRLHAATVTISPRDRSRCRVVGYSAHDPLFMSWALLDALRHFDGSPTAEVRRALARDRGIELDDALVRRLVDFGILQAG